jgi:hypothetical protein
MKIALTSQYPQRPLLHLLGLSCGFVEPGLKISPSMLPRLVDCGFHIVGHDDELRGPVVVMAAKRDYVCPGHSGRKIARN